MNQEILKALLGSQFFSVVFTKSDGTKRKMLCKLGVKKYLKGGQKSYDDKAKGHLTVYSVNDKGYRTVNLNTLEQIKVKGKVIRC